MKRIFTLGLFMLMIWGSISQSNAEGTKQLAPAATDPSTLNIRRNALQPFAWYGNTDSLNRLYIHIEDFTNEQVLVGFKKDTNELMTQDVYFRIKDASGTIVYGPTMVPASGTGYIQNHGNAVIGPNTLTGGAGGYTPFQFSPASNGDFYIEFNRDNPVILQNSECRLGLWDITVANTTSNTAIDGRVFSYNWGLNAGSFSNNFNGAFYIYSDDRIVTKAKFNDFEPWRFYVYCNRYGVQNTGIITDDRKSVAFEVTQPQFKLFLNNPDIDVYPTGGFLNFIPGEVNIEGCSGTYCINVEFNDAGLAEVLIDLNGTAGFQQSTEDILLTQNVTPGMNCFLWNGLDGLGGTVDTNLSLDIEAGLISGITHLPLWDSENNIGGLDITLVRPTNASLNVFYDDSNFQIDSLNLEGDASPGHVWSGNWGESRTVNTWWYAFKDTSGFIVSFGNECDCSETAPDTARGTAFLDANVNGVYDSLETGINNVLVVLYEDLGSNGLLDPTDILTDSVRTDSDGEYEFLIGFAAGKNYIIIVDTNTFPTPGVGTSSEILTLGFSCAGASVPGKDFGWVTLNSPLALDDSHAITVNGIAPVYVLNNDFDPDNNIYPATLSNTGLAGPFNGIVNSIDHVLGIVNYQPNVDYIGNDSLQYRVCDYTGLCDTAWIFISIVEPDTVCNSISNDTLYTNTNPGDTSFTWTVPAGAVIVTTLNDTMIVVNWSAVSEGNAQVCVVSNNGCGSSALQCLTTYIKSCNQPPVAVDDTVSTNEDTLLLIAILLNDSDPDSNLDTNATVILLNPGNGTAAVDTLTSIVTYTPNLNFNGQDTLSYIICDDFDLCDTADVFITVGAVNDAPLAVDDSSTTNEDTPVTVDVQANDSDLDGDALTTTILSGPSNGTASLVNGDSITYTPNPNFNGNDTLTYIISDGNGGTDTAIVVVTVTPVNDAPVAVDDATTTPEDTPITYHVQGNDSDVDGDALTTAIIGGPANGAAALVGDSIQYTPNANFNGNDTITYSVCDGGGLCDTAIFVITVNPANDPPVAVDDNDTTNEDTPLTVDVQANDSDLDGDALTTAILSGPSNGTASLVNGDSITYTPNPNFNGTDTLTYVISDGNGGTDTAIVVITVNPVNDAPVAVDDATTTPEDTIVTVDVQANDSDLDGDALTTTILIAPINGTATLVNGDSITYTPNANFYGNDTLTYIISDGNGGTDTAIVVVTVTPVNDAPVAVDDATTTPEDTPITYHVQGNDSDVDGDALTTAIIGGPANGAAALVGDSIQYTPNANFNGNDTITYSVCDGGGLCDTAIFVITVNPANDPPVAVDDNDTTNEDTPVTVDVQANDSDLDGDALTTAILSGPSNGTASLVNGDSIVYTPDPNFNGTDTLTYVISDGNGGTDTAIVVITVDPVNDAPLAVDDSSTTNEDTPVTVDVQANDSDLDGDALTTTIISAPTNGTASLVNGDSITYTPNPNFNGTDTLTYVISDGNGGTDTAIVVITVDPVNDPPVAVDDVTTTPEDVAVTYNVQGNDSDLDGDALTTAILSGPSNGTASLVNGDSITYTPNPNFNGNDTLTYVISDGNGGTDTAIVVITVGPINDAPVAVDDASTTNEVTPVTLDVQANDSDLDGDMLTTSILDSTNNGTLTVLNGDSIVYTPDPNFNGTDTLTYIISDGNGGTDTAIVVITVAPVNDAPLAVDDSSTTNEDTPVTVDVQANDSDLDGDALTTTILTAPSNGAASLVNGDSITYTPNPNFNGTDTLTYVISDGNGGTDTATVIITVDPVNDPPVAVDDVTTTPEDVAVTYNVQGNDSDLDGDALTTTILTAPSNGTAVVVNGDSITYTPNANFNGTDTLTYVISDGNGGTDTAIVVITVDPVNDPPVAVDDVTTTPEDVAVTYNVQGNDSDLDGDALTTTILSGPNNGTAVVVNGDSITYTPNPNFNGNDTLTYVISDGNGGTDTAIVVITVGPINDAPVAVDDASTTNEDTPVTVDVQANDSDLDGDALTTTILTAPSNGTAVVVNGDSITYTPNSNFNGTDTLTYVISDGNGGTDTASVVITVNPVNDPPVASNDAAITPEDSSVVIDVQVNDIDIDGDVLTTTVIAGPSNGTISIINGDSLFYVPNPSYNGFDTLIYVVCDPSNLCDTAFVYIDIGGVNDAPFAVDDTVIINEDDSIFVNVQLNDYDIDGDSLLTIVVIPSINGTAVVLNGDSISYVPNPNFFGLDTLTYILCDAFNACDSANVYFNVLPINDPPIANTDSVSTLENVSIAFPILPNDTDVENNIDSSSVNIIIGPFNGTAVFDQGTGLVNYNPNPFYVGTDSLYYLLCDLGFPVYCDTGMVIIEMGDVNYTPLAVNDIANTSEDTPLSGFTVLANDIDPDGDSLTVSTIPVFSPSNGTLLLNPDGSYLYTPNMNFNGIDSFAYVVCDNGTPVFCDTAVVTINISPVNDPPVAVNDSATTNEATPVVINVPLNDSDVDSNLDVSTVTVISGPSNGVVSVDPANGNISYTPNTGFTGTDNLAYIICDSGVPAYCDTALVVITVDNVNDSLIAVNDNVIVPEDSVIIFDPFTNDTDPDNNIDTATVSISTGPANGTAVVDPVTGNIAYTPNPNFNGLDSLVYGVCDTGSPIYCGSATVYITVTSVNDPIVAVHDTINTTEDNPVTANLISNDIDIDDNIDTSSIALISLPLNGNASVNPATGEITYTPNSNFSGIDSVLYTICDTGIPVTCDTGVVIINVGSVNDDPVAVDDFSSTDPGVPVVVDVQFNDIDPDGDTLTTTIISGPSNGVAAVINGDSITYTPNIIFLNGLDSITYVVCDNGIPQGCDTANVYIVVPITNLTPSAVNDFLVIQEDSTGTLNVVGNDSDPNGDSLSVTVTGGPLNGFVTNNGDGTLSYTPDPNFNGIDTIMYIACDTASLCDTAIVIINVTPVNDAPVAVMDTTSTIENTSVVLVTASNDSDVDGNLDITSVTLSINPLNGIVIVDPVTGNITYSPNANFNGVDSLQYIICDTGIPVLCDSAWQIIIISPVNSPIVVVDDTTSTFMNTPVNIAVITNDVDPEMDIDTSSLAVLSGPSNGMTTIDSVTGNILYTPNPGFNGYDTLVYEICDNGMPIYCGSATVTVLVGFVNLPPIANIDTSITQQNIPVSANLLTNDFDPNNNIDTNSIAIVSGPSNGLANINPNTGLAAYLPGFGYFGTDTIVYVICDQGAPIYCDTAIWIISVINENDPPIANNDAAITPPNMSTIIDVQFNDSDPDGDTLTTFILQNPIYGTIFVLNGDSVLYTPFVGVNSVIDTFVYVVCDNGIPGLCDTAIVTVIIPIINVPPVVSNEQVNILEDSTVVISQLANDYDPNGDTLLLTITGGPSNGSAVLNPDGTVTYTPNLNFNGLDTIFYQVCDSMLTCDSAFTVINVIPVNDPPIAVTDFGSALSGTPVVAPVLSNDIDIDGNIDVTSVIVIGGPSNGTATVNPVTGDITYVSSLTYGGIDTLMYVVCDQGLPVYCDTADVIIFVTLSNVPPVVVNDSATIFEDVPVVISILNNDSDPDNNLDTSSIAILSGPFNGTVTIDSITGQLNYLPNPNFNGIDSLVYIICDTGAPIYCDSATVYINVLPVNDPPVVVNDSASVNEDNPVVIAVVNNDSDFDNNLDTSSVSILSGPSNGTAVIDPITGNVTYTPNANFNGIDTIVYQICDTGLPIYCGSATVVITVNPVNDPPIAVDDTVNTIEDVPVVFNPLSNDLDVEGGIDSSSVTIIGGPNNGTAMVDPVTGQITYTPNLNYNGSDTITYVVCDLGMPVLCDTAIIVINVASVNSPPVAVNDTVSTNEDNPLIITVVNNDFDIDNNLDTLSTVILSGPNNGSASVDPVTGQIIYVPNANFNGTDTVVYIICDTGAPVLCDTAVIIINVIPVNDPPIAVDDTVTTNENVPVTFNPLANDIDVEDGLDSSSVAIISGPNNGTAVVDPITGQITYTPNPNFNGTDTITYVVCDLGSPVLCDTATIIINVGSVNNPPLAVDDADVTDEDTPITISVLSNDNDIDGNIDPTSVVVISGPNNGMAVVDPVTGAITYIPNMNFFGTDTFTYVVCDLGTPVYCDTAVVIITVNPVNDPPIAVNDTVSGNQGVPIDIVVDGNDTDIDGVVDPTTINIIIGPSNGNATVNPITGVITYVPNPEFFGIDSIVYIICDNGSPVLCDTATIYIFVQQGDPIVFVPNAFSPNGDLIYDYWVIDGLENYPNNKVKVYNRWGNLVYSKKGYDNSWGGTTNTGILVIGKDLPDGTYYYVIDLGDGSDADVGFVVIKRK